MRFLRPQARRFRGSPAAREASILWARFAEVLMSTRRSSLLTCSGPPLRRVTCLLTSAWLLACAVAAQIGPIPPDAQNPVQFMANAEQAVQRARQSQRPLLFYVPSRSDNSDLEDAQDRAFRHPIVRQLMTDYFIPVRLAQNTQNRQMLREIGAPGFFGMYMLAVTPDGELIGHFGPMEIAAPAALARKLGDMFIQYRRVYFEQQLQPVLEDPLAEPDAIRRALRRVREFLIVEADEAVAALLERERLPRDLRQQAMRTLAVLSTPLAAEAVLELVPQDRRAIQALGQFTPDGALALLDAVDARNPDEAREVYQAVVKITAIRDVRPPVFWVSADLNQRSDEIERIRPLVDAAAKRWRARELPLR